MPFNNYGIAAGQKKLLIRVFSWGLPLAMTVFIGASLRGGEYNLSAALGTTADEAISLSMPFNNCGIAAGQKKLLIRVFSWGLPLAMTVTRVSPAVSHMEALQAYTE